MSRTLTLNVAVLPGSGISLQRHQARLVVQGLGKGVALFSEGSERATASRRDTHTGLYRRVRLQAGETHTQGFTGGCDCKQERHTHRALQAGA